MITAAEAHRRIAEIVTPLGCESVSLDAAAGRLLAEDLIARENLPPFDNSAMDGYAVRAEDLRDASESRPKRLPIHGLRAAGDGLGEALRPGHAVRIFTGAPVPAGADAVIVQERARGDANGVTILCRPESGAHIRRAGEDVRAGEALLPRGRSLRPYEIALLAAQGFAVVPVIRTPRVAVLATGDELVPPGASLAFGQIRNANGPALAAGVRRWGGEIIDQRVVRDDPGDLETAVRAALAQADLVLVSGGASVGDFDHTPAVLEAIGATIVFWKVAIKPGKPLLFAQWTDGGAPKFIFGVPGNPVSALVCLEEFVRPAIEALQGHRPRYPSFHLEGTVENGYPTPVDRRQYLFCEARSEGGAFRVRVLRPQGSALLGMSCRANALAVAEVGVSLLRPGDRIPFRWLK